jgi:uncharacterized protein (TIGR00645 family)
MIGGTIISSPLQLGRRQASIYRHISTWTRNFASIGYVRPLSVLAPRHIRSSSAAAEACLFFERRGCPLDLERIVERILFASRWLLAPLYVGLAVLLLVFSIHFFLELFHLVERSFSLDDTEIILAALNMIDLALVAGLVVMVMLSGYENFVSRLNIVDAEKSIAWVGKLDSGTLKLKVAASIVAISAIQLLKGFMEIETITNDKLLWLTVIHLTFVVSAVLLAVMDRLIIGEHH